MKKRRKLYLIISGAILVVLIIGAVNYFYHSGNDYPVVGRNKQPANNKLDDVNRFLVEKDNERIQSFVERRGWEMKKTGSGLWYQILSNQTGKKIKEGDKVSIDYEIRLLDGTLCYTSDSTGLKQFVVGRQETMVGLQEGIKLLTENDKARFIIPPHLGYGLIGDEKRIPARAVLVYTLKVENVKHK